MDVRFSLDDARALLPQLQERAEVIVGMRADLADAQLALRLGSEPVGGTPAVKALEAHLHEAIEWFGAQGIQLKGIAPLIVDLPGDLAGEPVLLCWLEGEPSLEWYHRPEVGFIGRRRLPDTF